MFSPLKLSRIEKAWKLIGFTEILTLLEKMKGKGIVLTLQKVFHFYPRAGFYCDISFVCLSKKIRSPDRSNCYQ